MKRVAGFVELFTQKVPAVRVGHHMLSFINAIKLPDINTFQNLYIFFA